MSKNPLSLINNEILNFSDIIYVHNEIENKTEVIKKIEDKNKIPGIVLHSIYEYTNLENLISNFKQILILSIKNQDFQVKNLMKNPMN